MMPGHAVAAATPELLGIFRFNPRGVQCVPKTS